MKNSDLQLKMFNFRHYFISICDYYIVDFQNEPIEMNLELDK